MVKEATNSLMKKLESTMSEQPLSKKSPCDICGADGKKVEIEGIVGAICDNKECMEKAIIKVAVKKEKRKNERVEQLIDASGIPTKYRKIKTNYPIDYLIKEKGVFICGSAGTGKTVMACSIAIEHMKKEIKAVFKSVPKIIMEIQDSFKNDEEGSAYAKLKKLSEIEVLVLDDLGAEKMTDFVRQALYFLINEREQWDRTTIITSNYSLDRISTNLDSRISSRIAGMCERIALTGKDRRISGNDTT